MADRCIQSVARDGDIHAITCVFLLDKYRFISQHRWSAPHGDDHGRLAI